MRLIDADVLIDHLCEVMMTANEFGNIERVSEIGGCIGVIKGERTIERPHGEWIEERDKMGHLISRKCLLCKAYHDGMLINFCPNCGADMRPKEGDEKRRQEPCEILAEAMKEGDKENG